MRKPKKPFVLGCLLGCVLGAVGIAVVAVASLYALKGLWLRLIEDRLRVPPIALGLEADYAWTVVSLDGEILEMDQTKGKALFLNFWHPDCMNCLAQLPAVNRLYEQIAGGDIAFVSVAAGEEDEEELRIAVEEYGLQFPVYRIEGERPEVYKAWSTPATFIVAPNGEVVFKHVGAAKWDDPQSVRYLEELARQEVAPELDAMPGAA